MNLSDVQTIVYFASLVDESEVAQLNLDRLALRAECGTVNGGGDGR